MTNERKPSIGRDVHYVSYGTPKGEFSSTCRTAKITEVGGGDVVGLIVFNPTGEFFHPLIAGGCPHDEDDKPGGTWHWPEFV